MKTRISTLPFAALAAAAILSGCYTLPDGAVVEVTGAEVVERVMAEQGDGLSPLDSAASQSLGGGWEAGAPSGDGSAGDAAEPNPGEKGD